MKIDKFILKSFIVCCFLLSSGIVKAQLTVNNDRNPDQLVRNVLTGDGIQINSILYTGSADAIGFFNGQRSNIGLDSGLILSTGKIRDAIGPNNVPNKSASNNQPGDVDLNILSMPYPSFDAAVLEITFTPQADALRFRFVFGSEEYPESVSQNYNDVFGFFIEGPGFSGKQNLALIPNTSIPISIKSVNATENPGYYIDNTGGTSIQFDAFTRVMEINASVKPCSTYTIKIAIADVNDFIFDSGIFIEAQSFKSSMEDGITVKATAEKINECDSSYFVFSRTGTDLSQPLPIRYAISGTATMGDDYLSFNPDSITIPAGTKSVAIKVKAINDALIESPETIILTLLDPNPCDIIAPVKITINDFRPTPAIQHKVGCLKDMASVIIENVSAFDTVKWYNSSGILIQMGDIFVTPKKPYTLLYIEAIEKCSGRVLKDSVVIRFYDITANADTSVCPGDTIQLFAYSPEPGLRYTWTGTNVVFIPNANVPNPLAVIAQTTPILVKIDQKNTCGEKEIFVTVDKLGVSSYDYNICRSGSVQLEATGGTHYRWTPSAGLDNDSIANPLASPSETTTYTVEVSNATCSQNFEVVVQVDDEPEPDAGEDILICSRQIIRLEGSGSKYDKYEWSPATGLDSVNVARPLANPANTTTYILKAINGACFAYDTVVIYVVDSVSSDFSMQYDSCSRTVHLSNTHSTGQDELYWDLGDGTFSDKRDIVHQYKQDGSYTISHITNKSAPCVASRQVQVGFPEVDASRRRIPQAFSPNGDGINDTFKITGGTPACQIKQLLIYDRWGKALFDSKQNHSFEWDGSHQGNIVSPGVYVYILIGDGFEDKGFVAVVR